MRVPHPSIPGPTAILVTATVLASAAEAQSCTEFFDTHFTPQLWTQSILVETPDNVSVETTQVIDGGNPGAFRRVKVDWDGASNILVEHYLIGAVFDPAVQGPAATLSVSFDFRVESGDAGCGHPDVIGTGNALIRQGSRLFVAPALTSAEADGWQSGSVDLDDFGELETPTTLCGGGIDSSQKPDVGPAGMPLEFGFLTWKCAGEECDRTDNVDNFFVKVVPATADSEAIRSGVPPNADALRPGATSGLVLGATWDPYIDHAAFLPDALLDVLALGAAPTNLPSGLGTILCIPAVASFITLPGSTFSIPIPDDCSLLGATLCWQGVSWNGASIALTNALDTTIGSVDDAP